MTDLIPFLQEQTHVDGSWASATDGETCDVVKPATGEVIGTIPNLGRAETARAISAAKEAQLAWVAHSAEERADNLTELHHVLLEHQEDLARLMTLEQGKPPAESRGEIPYGASYIRWFAVGVNTGLFATAVAPFGGVRATGLGRDRSHEGMDEYFETKYICFGVI